MFCKSDYVKYGAQGIFQITEIRSMRFGPGQPAKSYYVLQPVAKEKAEVFVPVSNDRLTQKMQPVPTAEEIDDMIQRIRGQSIPWNPDRRERAADYQQILARHSEPELLLLIHTLYLRSLHSPKGLPSGDAQVFKQAKSLIDEEFSFSLHLPTEQIRDYIQTRLS